MKTFTQYVPIDTSIHRIAEIIKEMRERRYRIDDICVMGEKGILTFIGDSNDQREQTTPPEGSEEISGVDSQTIGNAEEESAAQEKGNAATPLESDDEAEEASKEREASRDPNL